MRTNEEIQKSIKDDILEIVKYTVMKNQKVDPEEISKAVADYIAKNPVSGVDPTDIANAINDYFVKNPMPTVPTNVSELTNDAGYLTSHQDLSSYATKTYTDDKVADHAKTTETQIKAIAEGLMDSVGYSADYKSIDIIAKNNDKKSIDVSPIITHASITELGDVDTTNKATGKALVYNDTTKKHEYVEVSGTDEKVKMDASGDAKYLGDLLDNVTITNENGELKVKKLDGQEVTVTEINYLKGLTMNVMDLVNMFANGGVKIINTPMATYADLLTIDKTSFISGIAYLVYVLADENHDNAKTTYLVDKDSATPTYFGYADSHRDFVTNPIDLASEITGKLGITNMDSDAIKALFMVDDTYKTATATNNAFSTHGAKALYDELVLAIGKKANDDDLTTHVDDTNIHVSTTEKDKWDKKVDEADLIAHTDDADIHVTLDDKAAWDKAQENVIESVKVNGEEITPDENKAVDIDLSNYVERDELQKLDEKLENQFATASGEFITLSDSVDGNTIELGVKGNSKQKQLQGYNLIPFPYDTNSKTENGIDWTVNEDGSVIANGTNTLSSTNVLKLNTNIPVVAGKRYIILDGTLNSNVLSTNMCSSFKDSYGNNITWSKDISTTGNGHTLNGKSGILTAPNNATMIFIWLRVSANATADNVLFKPMLVEVADDNSYPTEYEAYCGGVPSPNPSYPQEINSIGDNGSLVVKSCGKNLIPFPYYNGSDTRNGITATVNSNDGSINLAGTATNNYFFVLLHRNYNGKGFARQFRGKTITISGGTASPVLSLAIYDENGNNITPPNNEMLYDFGSSVTIAVPENACDMYSYYYCSSGAVLNTTLKPQLEVGEVATEYEPYKESATIIPLSEPLRSIGDIKDEITYQDGKWGVLRRLAKTVIDGDKNKVVLFNDTTLNLQRCTLVLNNLDTSYPNKNDSAISDKFICASYSNTKDGSLYVNTTGVCCIFANDTFANVDEANNWFVSNNTVVIYRLATPTFEPFADQSLQYIPTYDGVTHIFNDDTLSAEMMVKYPITDVSGIGSKNESKNANLTLEDKIIKGQRASLAVRGYSCPKLSDTCYDYVDENNVLHCKVGRVDLGSLKWVYASSAVRFQASISNKKIAQSIEEYTLLCCSKYEPNISPINNSKINMTISGYKDDGIYLYNFSYTDETTFKNAMQGVYLYYELATELTYSVLDNNVLDTIGTCTNLLKPSLANDIVNGVTITNNGDGTYTLSGTASSSSFFLLCSLYISQGKYKMLGTIKDEYRRIQCYIEKDSVRYCSNECHNLESGIYECFIRINENVTVNEVVKPMLTTNLSADYNSFVPYTGSTGTLNGDVAELQTALKSALARISALENK